MGKSAGSAPPAPDYRGAAEQTAQSQRVNQYTPYGNLVWSNQGNSEPEYIMNPSTTPTGKDGETAPGGFIPNPNYRAGNDQWSTTTTLSPGQQGILDKQTGLQNQFLSEVEGQGPMDLQTLSDRAYGTLTSRLDPQWQQRESAFENKMANQGIPMGSEAYGNASRDFQQGRNDAYQQANLAAIQTMPLSMDIYNSPLNRLNALTSGSQVSNPQFQGQGAGTNYMQAAQGQGQHAMGAYNADVAQANSANQGLTQAAMLAAMLMMSDRRLKRDIEKLSDDERGFGWYRFKYLWSDQIHIGVMADEVKEVMPQAVWRVGPWLAVDYGML